MNAAATVNFLNRSSARLFEIAGADTVNILRDDVTSDGAGGQIKTAATVVNDEPIGCNYTPPIIKGYKGEHADRLVSMQQYNITLPTTIDGAAVDLRSSDRLQVLATDARAAKLFRIVSLKDHSGVYYEAVCEQEDNT